jgi:hypothetical protein
MWKNFLLFAAAIFVAAQLSCLGDDTPTTPPTDNRPVITTIEASPFTIRPDTTCAISVTASDPNDDPLTFLYEATGGAIVGSENTAIFTADGNEGVAWVKVTVSDDEGLSRVGFVTVNKFVMAPLISLGVLSLDAASTANQCLAFAILPAQEIILLNTTIQNPIGQTFNFAGPSIIPAGQVFALQPQGSCYNLHPGTYRFTFRIRRNFDETPFDFVATHVQPADPPL